MMEKGDWTPQPSELKEWLIYHGRRLDRVMAGKQVLAKDLESTTMIGVLIEYIERLEKRVAGLEQKK